MLHIAIQVRDLIASNVSNLVEEAQNPEKMLRLLRGETEEAILGLTGDRARAQARAQRLAISVAECELRETDWSDKAEQAMSHQREDLARAALIEREEVRKRAAEHKSEIAAVEAEIKELDAALAALEAKLTETKRKLAECTLHAARTATTREAADARTRTQRNLDRIATIERRAEFAADDLAPTVPGVEAEIEALTLDRTIAAELELIRRKIAPKPGRAKG